MRQFRVFYEPLPLPYIHVAAHAQFVYCRHADYNVAKYVPYGPVKAVLPYLFRRAQENTAIAGQMSRELSLITKERKRRSA